MWRWRWITLDFSRNQIPMEVRSARVCIAKNIRQYKKTSVHHNGNLLDSGFNENSALIRASQTQGLAKTSEIQESSKYRDYPTESQNDPKKTVRIVYSAVQNGLRGFVKIHYNKYWLSYKIIKRLESELQVVQATPYLSKRRWSIFRKSPIIDKNTYNKLFKIIFKKNNCKTSNHFHLKINKY